MRSNSFPSIQGQSALRAFLRPFDPETVKLGDAHDPASYKKTCRKIDGHLGIPRRWSDSSTTFRRCTACEGGRHAAMLDAKNSGQKRHDHWSARRRAREH